MFIVFTNQCFTTVWTGFVIWVLFTSYAKFKFNEISDKIVLSLKQSNIRGLMNAICEHNYVECLTRDSNHFFRVITFIIYLIATIGFQIILFGVHKSDTKPMGRIIAAFIFFTCFWAVVGMNVMSTWISTSARKPYSTIYSIINSRTRMSSIQRLKVLAFIEKLSGPDIGFYCLDLFPMNGINFAQYLYVCGANYFLILGFV